MRRRALALLGAVAVTASACTGSGADGGRGATDADAALASDAVVVGADDATRTSFGPAPDVPDGPLAEDLAADLELLYASLERGIGVDPDVVEQIGTAGDARVAWDLADLLRFTAGSAAGDAAVAAFGELTGADVTESRSAWREVTDHLIAWDLPAAPEYVERKARLFTLVEPGWEPFFADEDAAIDWRLVSWGGVLIDDRPLGDDRPCVAGCIPALDDPAVTDADGGDWYDDDRTVFGVVVDGEARAYPQHQMQVHEMVNDTIGGVRLGIPYCTLCGSAQAWVTEEVPGTDDDLVLRTSGLLSRSNKVMYDLTTRSVLDTFTGAAVSGPLRDAGVQLEQVTVLATSWGEWKAAHPDTTIVAEDGGIGRTYPDDPLGGRDDDGPIFPVGDVDERLEIQTSVVGAVLPDGTAVAFDAAAARRVLDDGGVVAARGVTLVEDGGGLRALGPDGDDLPVHEAFWFAWSQFHPETDLWTLDTDATTAPDAG